MSLINRIALAVVAVLPFAGFSANTIWVDRQNGNDEYVGEGLGSEAHPFASIQAAVNAATDGDTVKVLPGDYDNGGYYLANEYSNRVYIAKRIHLVSTEGASKTTIWGHWDSGDTKNNGTNLAGDGVRCVRIDNSNKKKGYGAVVEGFTLRDGYAPSAGGYGGALRASTTEGAFLVDCVITNCSGTTASSTGNGVIRDGILVRCAVYDSVAWSTFVYGVAWNCVFAGNAGTRGVFGASKAVNCSLSDNDALEYLCFNRCTIVNTISDGKKKEHTAGSMDSTSAYAKTGVFVDPANRDWRLLYGSAATGLADAAQLTNYVDFTQAAFPIAFTDFAGNKLPSNGVINAGAVQTVKTPNVWWVDRLGGNDAYEGEGLGSEAHPFASIQAAVDAAIDGDTVKVLPGDYDNGGYVDETGHKNRVFIKKRVRIVSTEGAAKTTIWGQWDSGDTKNDGTNLAGDGVRCVRVCNFDKVSGLEYIGIYGHGSVLEGFTLRNGYAAMSHGYGGAVLVDKKHQGVFVIDSVITNCTGTTELNSSNGVVVRAVIVRCAVYDSFAWCILTLGWAWNSVFYGNRAGRAVLGYSPSANCSMADNKCQYLMLSSNEELDPLYSSLSQGEPTKISNIDILPIVDSYAGAENAFVNPAQGDWRLVADAPGIGNSSIGQVGSIIDFSLTPYEIAPKDYHGNTMPDGAVANAGAVQELAAYVCIDEPLVGGWDVSYTTQGEKQYIELGGPDITVSVRPNLESAKRPVVGLVTNGVELALEDVLGGVVVTVPNADGGKLELSYVYGTNWYVNATTGNDANSGFSSGEAFATLAAACTNEYLFAGDVIRVAEGVYSNGVVMTEGKEVGARAYVKSGVTLQAEGRKENTFIVGASAADGNIDNPDGIKSGGETFETGCGRGAVRGVLLEDNATVRGFTICGGHTRGYLDKVSNLSSCEYSGGGVAGINYEQSLHSSRIVEDCVITNNAAAWGGGVYGVTARRSVIRDNWSERYGGNGSYASYESCLLGAAKGGSFAIFYVFSLENTTVTDEDRLKSYYLSGTIYVPTNCIFLCKMPLDVRTTNSVGCIYGTFNATGNVVMPGLLSDEATSEFVDDRAAAGLDESYRPLKSSLAVDFCRDAPGAGSPRDLDGNARMMNAVVDCGCYEYDWRGDYAGDMSARRRITVTDVSPGVVEAAGKVRLSDGCAIAANWAHGADASCMLPVSISGAGVLSLYVNGTLAATLTAADESYAWEATAKESDIRFVFSGEGYAELGKAKNLRRMVITVL